MKKSLILSALLIGSINIHAIEAQKLMFGLDYSSGSGELEEGSLSTTIDKFDSSSNSFKIGYTLENDNRFVFSYEITQKEFIDKSKQWYGKNNPELLFYNFDWQFTYPYNSLAPYWTIGLAGATLEDSGVYFKDGRDLQGVSFNYGVGLLYNITSNIEFELAYNCKSIGWENVDTTNTTDTVSKIGQFEVGVNFFF